MQHQKNYRSKNKNVQEDSAMRRHAKEVHKDKNIAYRMEIVKTFKKPMARQVQQRGSQWIIINVWNNLPGNNDQSTMTFHLEIENKNNSASDLPSIDTKPWQGTWRMFETSWDTNIANLKFTLWSYKTVK